MIKYVDFISIPVNDQKRALTFYTERLGFTVFTDQPFDDERRWIELKIGGSQTKVVLFTPDEHKDRVGTFLNASFVCDDLERTYQALRERGVEFVAPPKKEPWGSMMILKDSEGNQLLVSEK